MRLFEGAVGPTRLATASATARLDSQQRLAFKCHLEPAQARHTGHVQLSGSLPLLLATPSPHTVLSSTFLTAPVLVIPLPCSSYEQPPSPPGTLPPSVSYLLPSPFPLLPHGGLLQPLVCVFSLLHPTHLPHHTPPPCPLFAPPCPFIFTYPSAFDSNPPGLSSDPLTQVPLHPSWCLHMLLTTLAAACCPGSSRNVGCLVA